MHTHKHIRKQLLRPNTLTQMQNFESRLVNYWQPNVACTQVTKRSVRYECVLCFVPVCLCIALIKPSDTSLPISHMKVILNEDAVVALYLIKQVRKTAHVHIYIFAAICAYYISVCDHILFK